MNSLKQWLASPDIPFNTSICYYQSLPIALKDMFVWTGVKTCSSCPCRTLVHEGFHIELFFLLLSTCPFESTRERDWRTVGVQKVRNLLDEYLTPQLLKVYSSPPPSFSARAGNCFLPFPSHSEDRPQNKDIMLWVVFVLILNFIVS